MYGSPYSFDIARTTDLHNLDTQFDDFCSLLLAGKLILREGDHLTLLVFRGLVFSLNHPVWAGRGDQFHFTR